MSMMRVMKLIIFLVFLGYIIIWTLLPTKLYKNRWTPTLESKLSSTYFQDQGVNLLLFTFPVMFMAVCGCVYLHFHKKQARISTSTIRHRLSFLRRPMLVMNPLGIVTAVEIAFSAMFIALLIWSLANYLYISFGHLHMHKQGEKVWQAKFRSVSLRLGYIGNVTWAFIFFPVTRGSSILCIFGLTSESSIKYHIWLGHISMLLFTAHSLGFVAYYAMTNQMLEMLEWSKTYVSNVAGEIAFVFAIGMWVTSSYSIRRKKFEVFLYTHHLYILYIIFYALHVGAAYFCMILPGIFLFLVDRYLRFLQSMQHARLVSARILPSGTLELNFSKDPGLYYNPTSVMYMNVPSISKLQWHPFTVTSNCEMEPHVLTIVIKREGSWSQKLFNQISSNSMDHLQMSVEGPYGPSSSHFLRHDLLVMISGGSGITPFISIIRQIISQTTKPNTQIPRVLLVCAFKNSSDLSMLQLLLPIDVSSSQHINKLNLQIEAYVTRDQDHSIEPDTEIQTKRFNPNPGDSPVSALLGPDNWLWLGAIIASSFVMFLLLLGLVNRYYIYPIDKMSNVIYHYSYFVMWDMFLGCACVVVVCSGVILWRKKQNVKSSAQQIQNLESEMETPSELESLPRQSLVEATNVHFGARPDLKKILLGCKGSDVGVLTCGPRSMRHEVAKICSSGLAHNLHFESITFNW